MPKSKRTKLVSLTRTKKKGKDGKQSLFQEVQESADSYTHIYMFSIENVRNYFLKEIRTELKETNRFFMGKNRVMAHALGTTSENEYKQNFHQISKRLVGNVGLIFSNTSHEDLKKYFEEHSKRDYARAGYICPETIVIPEGPLKWGVDNILHSMEPTVRALGLPTQLKNGIVTMLREHTVCKKGEPLTVEQAKLLKLLLKPLAEFRLEILGYWHDNSFHVIKEPDLIQKSSKKTQKKKNKKSQQQQEEEGEEEGEEGEDGEDDENMEDGS